MIKLANVSKYYHNEGTVTLGLRKINLELNLGEFVAVTGESGSGKSTLLNVLSGIDTYEDGEMFLDGEETSYYDNADWEEYRRDSVGFIFQNYNLIDSYTVLRNVETALLIQGMDKKNRISKAKAIIERVGLTSHMRHRASKLSGGEKQRLSIARALAKETKIIVADEPTGNLDSESGKKILKLLSEVSDGRLVIIVTHNFEFAEPYVTRKIRLFDGEVVEDKILKPSTVKEIPEKPEYKMRKIIKAMTIAFYNLLSTPKKTLLMFFVALITILFVFLDYGSYLVMSDDLQESYSNLNAYPERLIVTRKDQEPMTADDYDLIDGLFEVDNIIKEDLIVDTMFTASLSIDQNFYYFDGFPCLTGKYDIQPITGRKPTGENELALAFNPYSGDEDHLADILNEPIEFSVSRRDEYSSIGRVFEIVGVYVTSGESEVILSEAGLNALYQSAKVSSFGYELKSVTAFGENPINYQLITSDPALSGSDLLISSYTYYNPDDPNFLTTEIWLNGTKMDPAYDSTGKMSYGTINVSPAFFETLVIADDFQYTVNLKDSGDANRLMSKLFDYGYYAFSPYFDQPMNFNALLTTINKLFSSIGVYLTIFVIYIIAYLVIRSIMLSKRHDYTILRIVGMKHSELKTITKGEILTVFFVAFVFILLLFIALVMVYPVTMAPIIDSLEFLDYLLLTAATFAVGALIAWRFNRLMTKKSLFMNLKVEGE